MWLYNTVVFTQVFLFVVVLCEVKNAPCVTPNGENATCVSLLSCKILLEAILEVDVNKEVREFAKQSQCGHDKRPLVCCGSASTFKNDINSPESKLLPDKQNCGYFSESDRITGGEITKFNEFPWTVLLGYKNTLDDSFAGFKCGGTLINDRYVLTAAHCLTVALHSDFVPQIIRLGEWNISSENDCDTIMSLNSYCADPVIDLEIESMMIHPNYSRRIGSNDIALVKLNETVKFSEFVQPICLISGDDPGLKHGEHLVTTGWGVTENGTVSDIKLKVRVPVVSEEECRKKYALLRSTILDTHICAGGERGKDACRGDSGGPLMKTVINSINKANQWFLEGIVSSGAGCGNHGIPGIYTKVSKYVDWIISNLGDPNSL